jgi:hypothetical protein
MKNPFIYMETLTFVTELLILLGAGWAMRQLLAEPPAPQEEMIPIPVEDQRRPVNR